MNVVPSHVDRARRNLQRRSLVASGVIVFGLLCAACAARSGPVLLRNSAVERISDDAVRVRWPHTFSAGDVKVFSGTSPDRIDRKTAIATGTGGAIEIRSPAHQRLYFEIASADGQTSPIVAERRLPLDGSQNFRDLGGYETSDGHRVRWGRLYRSDDLAGLSDADREYLQRIGIRLICDFRSDLERTAVPAKEMTARGMNTINLTIQSGSMDPAVMRRKIRTGGVVGLEMERTLQSAYASYVTDYAHEWASMFERIADPDNLPAVLHCTAGKDRTGFASALVLLALGVPREVVYEDYLLTNTYLENFRRFVLRWTPFYSFFRTSNDDLLPLLEARRVYLETSIATIERMYGSVDAYLEGELGVDAERRAALRRNLLS